eukprot:CAMPEP_0198255396 /NCGR_PEP_ID=MMETSP1447-20131203/5528_1 /TAXON_ID=420782 /ORGANISM="Chaetoceros dichaeta, Strain CCMP1751" /LENGTH=31 /DNA_ID= /DNA_START= /DNA_END= /DNA_ORIENTATION=
MPILSAFGVVGFNPDTIWWNGFYLVIGIEGP